MSLHISLVLMVILSICRAYESHLNREDGSFYFPKFRPEIFYDNKVLPEDREIDVFIFREQPQRVFFLLEGTRRPLLLTVTPCSAPIEWRLSFQTFRDIPSLDQKDPWHNQVLHLQPMDAPAMMASYYGRERRSYTNPKAFPGLYTLELESPSHDVSVKVHVSTKPASHASYYPTLPPDPKVEVVKVRRNRVLIKWKHSPTPSQGDISYCATANPRDNYHSFCAVTADIYGDVPTTPPTSAGFGFSWEKNTRKSFSTKITDLRKTIEPKSDVIMSCVGKKTWHRFSRLKRGTKYFFDVFVTYTHNNATSTYTGTSATTTNTTTPSKVTDNSLSPIILDESNKYTVSTKYFLNNPADSVSFFVQSCFGPGPIHISISRGEKELLSAEVMDLKLLTLSGPPNGTYVITMSSNLHKLRKARMWVSKKYQSFPFPVLPNDRSVKVFDTLTTCNSVTLGWEISLDEKVKYCLYKRTVTPGSMRLFAKPQNFCEESKDGNTGREKILCRRYHRFSRQRFNNVIMQKVQGLDPGTTYLFEVQVTKSKGRMLPYEQVWVTTRKTCSLVKSKR